MSELHFENVSVSFGSGQRTTRAVDGVDLRVPSGTVVGLVGESGSGKSTLARAAVGLVSCTAGSVRVDGELVPPAGSRRRSPSPAQLVFQDPNSSLDPRMRIGDTIAEAIPRSANMSRQARDAEVARLLDLVHLDPSDAHHYPRSMSGGQRQRVAIARALAARPRVLIADEITSALDVSVQGSILNLVREFQSELDLTMLYISHNLGVIRYVCDQIAVMYLGRIVEVATADDLLVSPQHPYTRSLIDAIPKLERADDSSVARPVRISGALSRDLPDPRRPPSGCRFRTRCPIGPLDDATRTICVADDPSIGADERRHRSACHFATPADGVG